MIVLNSVIYHLLFIIDCICVACRRVCSTEDAGELYLWYIIYIMYLFLFCLNREWFWKMCWSEWRELLFRTRTVLGRARRRCWTETCVKYKRFTVKSAPFWIEDFGRTARLPAVKRSNAQRSIRTITPWRKHRARREESTHRVWSNKLYLQIQHHHFCLCVFFSFRTFLTQTRRLKASERSSKATIAKTCFYRIIHLSNGTHVSLKTTTSVSKVSQDFNRTGNLCKQHSSANFIISGFYLSSKDSDLVLDRAAVP